MKILAWILALWIVVFSVPIGKWKALSDNDRETLRTTVITKFCLLYHQQKGVNKFKIKEDVKDGIWRLHIIPLPDII